MRKKLAFVGPVYCESVFHIMGHLEKEMGTKLPFVPSIR